MSVELLIHAQTHRKAQKGFVETVRDVSVLAIHPWGNREGLPDYVILRITDGSKVEVDHYTDNWKNELSYELLGENAEGRRYKISVNPKIVTEFGVTKGVAIGVKKVLEDEYSAVLFDAALNRQYAIFDIPNPTSVGWTLYVQQIKATLLDRFESQVDTRRYIFSPSDVDIAIAAGGKISLTKAQTLARVVDRLA